MYKSKSWTLGSFYGASKGSEILVTRPCDSAGISMYKWQYQSNVDDQQGPEGNSYLNQTVLVQGFKMTTRKGWLPVDEWSEWSDWWFARILAKLCLAMSPQWLTRTSALCVFVLWKTHQRDLGTFEQPSTTSHTRIYLRSVLLFELLYVQKSSCPPASSPFGRR